MVDWRNLIGSDSVGGLTIPPFWFPVAVAAGAGAAAYMAGSGFIEVARLTCDLASASCQSIRANPSAAIAFGRTLAGFTVGFTLPVMVILHSGMVSIAAELEILRLTVADDRVFNTHPKPQPVIEDPDDLDESFTRLPPFNPTPSPMGQNQRTAAPAALFATRRRAPSVPHWFDSLTAEQWDALLKIARDGKTVPFNSLERNGFTRPDVKKLRTALVADGLAYMDGGNCILLPNGRFTIEHLAKRAAGRGYK